jgi:FkbM family methyltransferase
MAVGAAALPWPQPVRRAVRAARGARRRADQRRLEARLAGPRLLRAFAATYPEAFFVEIGANDGEQHDHLRPILERSRWRGIMVEPVPFVFERLQANYRGLPQISLENAAIAERDGELPFYHLREVADREREGLPRWYDGIGSFSKEGVLGHAALLPELERRLVQRTVPALTFDSLCAKHAAPAVDLLLLDTEGYDHVILDSIDWERHRPRLVVYEHYHFARAQRERTRGLMRDLGYDVLAEGFDTWCLQAADDALSDTFRTLEPAIPAACAEEDRPR